MDTVVETIMTLANNFMIFEVNVNICRFGAFKKQEIERKAFLYIRNCVVMFVSLAGSDPGRERYPVVYP